MQHNIQEKKNCHRNKLNFILQSNKSTANKGVLKRVRPTHSYFRSV
jgi:hypothetical protein